jgi:hypothetical protein
MVNSILTAQFLFLYLAPINSVALLPVIALLLNIHSNILMQAVCCLSLHAAVNCGSAPVITGAIPAFSSAAPTTYGSKPLRYGCGSGYWFARSTTEAMASCSTDGRWMVNGMVDANKWPSCIREYTDTSGC